MEKLHHCHFERSGLIQEITRRPHVVAITVNGASLYGQEAIEYIEALPKEMKYVPMGCYDPLPDGSCPGHIIN